jgi:hypothetical protein
MKIRRLVTPDGIAILALIALWLLFFWRLFTPVTADQASLEKGDFSGQFVAFGAYQYQRLMVGEVPLWNPYNNGGLPFIADTQAAVFYPPRLITIGLSKLAGGWTYHALELEMTAHVLVYSLFMYLLVRRISLGAKGSVYGAWVAAVIGSYGGFLTSYPPLQLALLEAAIWLPLAMLGIHEAARQERIRWRWLVLSGVALGLSWMAGHPQTSWFSTYLLIAYLAYRSYQKRYRWTGVVRGIIIFGGIAGGMSAVQLLPGLEYLALTSRTEFGFDAKGNGFPLRDVIQFLFPGVVSLWSPLYVGVGGLILSIIAIAKRLPNSLFWGVVALIGLVLSLGANSPIYALFYNMMPGMRFFRGQERAAFLVANSLAILAGIGAANLTSWSVEQKSTFTRNIRWGFIGFGGLCVGLATVVFYVWLGNREALNHTLGVAIFSSAMALIALTLIWAIINRPQSMLYMWVLAGLIAFELFTVNMDTESNYDPVPPTQQLSMTPPPLIAQVRSDNDIPFRVDGYRAVHDNYGSLYDVADIRGISPLFLDSTHAIIQTDLINPIAWELFAVRYVYMDWKTLPVPSEIIGSGADRYGSVNLHRLADPRPFALMVYETMIVDSDQDARNLLTNGTINPRHTIILNRDPGLSLTTNTTLQAETTITNFQPEQFTIQVNTPNEGILSIANPDYPGWQATIDGQSTEILRTYGALQGVVVPAGEHTITLVYNPLTYRIGLVVSLVTWVGLGILGIRWVVNKGQYARGKRASKLG